MEKITSTTGQSGDLFGNRPFLRSDLVVRRKLPPELIAARRTMSPAPAKTGTSREKAHCASDLPESAVHAEARKVIFH